jgi:branched-chain amino acid transport system ATP-binding protein
VSAVAALSVEGLSVTLGGTRILRSVALEVAPGSTVALIGRNGAGKTTTLRAIMGLVPAESGTIRFHGALMNDLPTHQRARLGLGYVPEDRRMISALSVESNVLLPADASGLAPAERRARLERVYALLPELTKMRERLAGSLSGGQQKMVALGRALMIGSRLLLLDEPFQGLSPALSRAYAETLAGLRGQDRELAILVAEANPSLLRPLAQTWYAIERGVVMRQDEHRFQPAPSA